MKKKTKKIKMVYICLGDSFWTGNGWTTVRQFAKKYRLVEALPIILKRFNNRRPRPRMRLVSYYEQKATRAAAALKKKRLLENARLKV